MCNLYNLQRSPAEVAQLFNARDDLGGANFGEEVYPGYPGAVVAEGRLRQMSWGFPLVMKGRNGQPLKPKPVNNARTDKLDSFFWRDSFENRRCLIPVSAWAEAEGQKGSMTRSWLSRPDADVFAVAGVWRDSAEWGAVYSMLMTSAAGEAAKVHTRMPVLLERENQAVWADGSPGDAFALCRPWEGALVLDRTDQPWTGGVSRSERML